MGNYLRIARVYMRLAPAAVWLFLFVCLLSVSADDQQQTLKSSRATKVASLSASFQENRTWQCLRTSMLAY